MTVALAIFIGSAAALVLMLALKAIQERFGVLLFWPHARNRMEVRMKHAAFAAERKVQAFTHRHIYVFLHYILVKVRNAMSRVQGRIDRKANQLMNIVSGKESLHMRETATHFLHDITRFKKGAKK